jgi:hypothetical protein
VRLADQIGLTPAGLKENGWRISTDEVAAKRAEEPASSDVRRRRRRHGRSGG